MNAIFVFSTLLGLPHPQNLAVKEFCYVHRGICRQKFTAFFARVSERFRLNSVLGIMFVNFALQKSTRAAASSSAASSFSSSSPSAIVVTLLSRCPDILFLHLLLRLLELLSLLPLSPSSPSPSMAPFLCSCCSLCCLSPCSHFTFQPMHDIVIMLKLLSDASCWVTGIGVTSPKIRGGKKIFKVFRGPK